MANTTVTAKCYKNTGYNSINVPDTPALLNSADAITFPAMDIINIRYLTSIKLKITNTDALNSGDTESYIENIDYIRLKKGEKKAYYSVVGYEPTSYDVYTFFVVYDPWLTNGGTALITQNNVLDGMTIRHHVAKSNDKFGKFCEKDDMLVLAEPLRLEHEGYKLVEDYATGKHHIFDGNKCVFFSGTTVRGGTVVDSTSLKIVRSSLDLMTMSNNNSIEWNAYRVDGVVEAAYPKVKPAPEAGTTITIPSGFFQTPDFSSDDPWSIHSIPSITMEPYQKYYAPGFYDVDQSIAQARSMGVENAISASWAVPKGYIAHSAGTGGELTGITGLSLAESLDFEGSDVYDFKYAVKNSSGSTYTPNNLRIFYGEHNRYCLTAIATGDHAEYLPEELYGTLDGSTDGTPITVPWLGVCVDPRAGGRPYFNYIKLRDGALYYASDRKMLNFYNGCVAGMEWAESPIQYTTISGSDFNRANATLDTGYSYGTSDFASRVLNAGGIGNYAGVSASSVVGMLAGSKGSTGSLSQLAGVAQSGLSAASYSLGSDIGGFLTKHLPKQFEPLEDLASDIFAGTNKEAAADRIRERQKQYEVAKFQLNNNQPVSEIAFPFTPTLRDATTNGCAAYRYRPTDNDLIKFDTVLNMYGYKITEPVKPAHFTNRSKYNYLQVAGISFGDGIVNNRDRDMLASMFATGIRIWHVAPSASHYKGTANS